MVDAKSKRVLTIVADNKEDRAFFRLLFKHSKTISEALGSKGYDAEKIRAKMNSTKIATKSHIKYDTMKALFKKA
jgi:hypothetical protein